MNTAAHPSRTKVALMNMNQREKVLMTFFFKNRAQQQIELCTPEEAQVAVFDLDDVGAKGAWDEFHKRHSIPTVVLSVSEQMALEQGEDGGKWVAKPINPQKLLDAILDSARLPSVPLPRTTWPEAEPESESTIDREPEKDQGAIIESERAEKETAEAPGSMPPSEPKPGPGNARMRAALLARGANDTSATKGTKISEPSPTARIIPLKPRQQSEEVPQSEQGRANLFSDHIPDLIMNY